MGAITAEQGTFNPFISSKAATVPPSSFSLSFSLTLSFVKYQETIPTDCTNQTSICSTSFSFCTLHEWMQNATGLRDVTVLEWKQDLHSGASTGRGKREEKSERKGHNFYHTGNLHPVLSAFPVLSTWQRGGFHQAMSWGKRGSGRKDVRPLFRPRAFEEMDLWSAPWIQRLFCGIGQEVTGLVASALYNWWRYCAEPRTDLTWKGTPVGRVAALHLSSACGELQSSAACPCSLPAALLQLVRGATETGAMKATKEIFWHVHSPEWVMLTTQIIYNPAKICLRAVKI